MIHDQVKVDADLIHTLYAHILEGILQLRLINHFLEGMQVQIEHLILLNDKTPQIQDLIHGVLLEASKTRCLLENRVKALVKLLT
jgi:hypothetical protein